MTRVECDGCGKTLHHGDLWTLTVKRAGSTATPNYDLCAECAGLALAAARAAIVSISACQSTDESAAALADAPALKTARDAARAPVLALGA